MAHVTSGAEFHCVCVERGLAGERTSPSSREERMADTARLAAEGPERMIAVLEANADYFEALFDRLDAAQLETLAFHNHGPRPARWFLPHRLAEVVFHRWDVQASLGRATPPAGGRPCNTSHAIPPTASRATAPATHFLMREILPRRRP